MIDTLFLRLFHDGGGMDLLSAVPPLFESIYGCNHMSGSEYVSGWMQGLKMTVRPHTLSITGGSICKWHFGENYRTMDKQDIRQAIERLSDTLHLNMGEADVTRVDFGLNMIMRQEVDTYLNHLGELRHYRRLSNIGSLYYTGNGKCLCFYDKNREAAEKGGYNEIPELYRGKNVLRYEMRYTNKIARQFNREFLTASMLYDDSIYTAMSRSWKDGYKEIQKINDIVPNFDMIKTKKEMDRLGRLLLAEHYGGQLSMLGHIQEAYKSGTLTKKQAHDLKAAVNEAYNTDGMVEKSKAISELDSKVRQACILYGL